MTGLDHFRFPAATIWDSIATMGRVQFEGRGAGMDAGIEPELTFRYAPACAQPGCDRAPSFKIAAAWSYGPLHERKGYGLACDRHRDALLMRAVERRRALAVGDDEQVGPVEATPLSLAPVCPAAPAP